MEKNTWNIIFVALAANYDGTNIHDTEVEYGISKFEGDLKKTAYSSYLKVTMMITGNSDNYKKAKLFKNNYNNEMGLIEEIPFDCYNNNDFRDFFNRFNSNAKKDKYIFILLAHSNGAGFLLKKIDNKFKQFTTVDLKDSLKASFGEKKIDCFLALNCTIQSLETNIIFGDTFNYIVGSQQPLSPYSIYYSNLFNNIIKEQDPNKKFNINTELLLCSFIYSSYQNYILNLQNNKDKEVSNAEVEYLAFSICLTKTTYAFECNLLLNVFASKLDLEENADHTNNTLDGQNIKYALSSCLDPSFSKGVDIIDSIHFLSLLKEIYENDIEKRDTITQLIETIQNIIILNCTSSNNFKDDYYNSDDDYFPTYLPLGLGLFIPERSTDMNKTIADVYENIFAIQNKQKLKLTYFDWKRVIDNRLRNNKDVEEFFKINNFELWSQNQKSFIDISNKNSIKLKLPKQVLNLNGLESNPFKFGF